MMLMTDSDIFGSPVTHEDVVGHLNNLKRLYGMDDAEVDSTTAQQAALLKQKQAELLK